MNLRVKRIFAFAFKKMNFNRLIKSRFSISTTNYRKNIDFVDRHFRRPPGTTHQFSIGHFKKQLDHFIWSLDTKHLENKCASFGISNDVYLKAIQDFKESLRNDSISYLRHEDLMTHLQASSPMDKLVLPAFLRFIRTNFPQSVQKLKSLSSKLDLENPANLFPDARQVKRKLIMHVGPTNS